MQYVQKYTGFLRRLKPLYELYNLSVRKSLLHNQALYKQWGIHKSIISDIDSRDFETIQEPFQPWLDKDPTKEQISHQVGFDEFPANIQESILQWPEKGYLILEGFLEDKRVEAILKEVNRLLTDKSVDFNYTGTKIMDAHRHSEVMDACFRDEQLLRLMSFLLGKKVVPFQTINFMEGSRQRAHADVMHMTTFPKGFLIAAWVALEDIHPDAGPLFYYPGSHQWPYVGNKELGLAKNAWLIEPNVNTRYEDYQEAQIKKRGAKPEVFLARKGDLLVWHANLLHGGMPVLNPTLTRKSMVAHYFAEGVICYHEISQRPAIIKG